MSLRAFGLQALQAHLCTALSCAVLFATGCQKETPQAAAESVGRSSQALSGDSGSDAAPPSPSIGSFALYATEAIELNGGSLVTGCNVGVENTTGPFLGGNAAAYFNSNAKVQSSQTLYASTVYLNSGVSLGPIDTGSILGNPGATYGTVSSFPAMPAAPSMPAATAGSTSVNLNSGVSQTLAPGAYGSVSINSSATLTLSGGTYVFSSLTLNGGTLAVAAPTSLSVTGSFNNGTGSYLGPAAGSGLTAKSLALYFDTSSGINVNSGVTIDALVVATNALVTVNTAQFTGALAAAQVVMNSGATITCQDSFGSLGGGGGNLCAGVTCTASDACHIPGVCQPSTGVCTNPTAANGTACNDGNACTQTDTCQAGACVGSNAVTCTASGQCTVAGTCNPATGTCSSPAAPNGTACNDGNACTQTDACESGACVGSNPVTCTASGPCTVAGTCDTTTGVCSNPAAPNGTSCNDGNACTQTDSCQSGTCVGSNPVICTASGQCTVAGTCDTTTGVCSNPVAANGSTCSDGNACTVGDACQSGTCVGGGRPSRAWPPTSATRAGRAIRRTARARIPACQTGRDARTTTPARAETCAKRAHASAARR